MPISSQDASQDTDPLATFEKWIKAAELAGEKAPEAMTVATATKAGLPSARILLLKSFDEKGFVFFTNANSRKGKDLHENPFAALLFLWKTIDRQVRIEGKITLIPPQEADAYFQTRPYLSKVGAHISNQSGILPSRRHLEEELEAQKKIYADSGEVPRPDYWKGYCVCPDLFEFWEAKPFRLHNRVQWRRQENDGTSPWVKELLYP